MPENMKDYFKHNCKSHIIANMTKKIVMMPQNSSIEINENQSK